MACHVIKIKLQTNYRRVAGGAATTARRQWQITAVATAADRTTRICPMVEGAPFIRSGMINQTLRAAPINL
ncbi:hypothetical protein Y032_0004g1934 [Ancylostoma ceylanicum]|uniref:Uncharacterized protein n=1 Tax=Ancylostoma ceylanicum TaxID=53326 RepID=A0A016VUU9_9BILA|nr:hypothetical protein Y032_0004g1934 [Ancylostoma ceylanicum]